MRLRAGLAEQRDQDHRADHGLVSPRGGGRPHSGHLETLRHLQVLPGAGELACSGLMGGTA